ncbi:nuclear transport factor 2 family protein [Planctomonas sp. JC2975]|uniref:nuclear transport factor 2 family protein n=1 Tax=Planctomonas sp. JC2975 TaxID=2729626 RepID=UPI0014765B84|nr:nuclear transport factor 2 family protein [Planctomonas sp. JC2975]NNC11781.1 nuclear transport factor 2 family protein [Planctomonas sp. JC2975]
MSELVQHWIEGYLRAWESNEPDDIRALFTDDATYRTAPFRDPWRGADDIVTEWIRRKDEPGDAAFTWELSGEDGDRAFVQGTTVYDDITYSNLWVIDFAPDGRAAAYTEWWMDRASPPE